MGLPKLLGGNPITDKDPLQVTGGAGIGTPDDLDTDNTVIGLLKRFLSRWPAALGPAAAAASTPVVLAQGGAVTNRSVTVAAGGTREQAAPSNTARRFLYLENPITETERAWFSLVGNANAGSPSLSLEPGQSITYDGTFIPTGAVDVLAATTGHKITVWEG